MKVNLSSLGNFAIFVAGLIVGTVVLSRCQIHEIKKDMKELAEKVHESKNDEHQIE